MRRLLLVPLLLLPLAACYTSETRVLDETSSIQLAGITEGLYCHVENRLDPPQVAVDFTISESLGDNRCRDLHFDPATGRYLDNRSTSIELRIGDMDMPVYLLQVQTAHNAPARFAPLVAVDGLFIQYDPAGRWPDGLVEASGLALDQEGILEATEPSYVLHVLFKAFDLALERFRADMAYVEDEAGPRLEFRDIDTAYSYIAYVHEDWKGDPGRMRAAFLAVADRLGLQKLDRRFARVY